MVKSTYVLDLETAATLDRLARDWRVSKSEVLRRAIRSAAAAATPDRVEVLRRLQRAVKAERTDLDRWAETVHAERRATRGRPTQERRRR
jgi:hypothetical protein